MPRDVSHKPMSARLQAAIRLCQPAKVREQIDKGSGLKGAVVYALHGHFSEMRGADAGPEILRIVLESGADPNQHDEFEKSALADAAHNGDAQALGLLLRHGANPNIENGDALVLACGNADLENVLLLLEAGANPVLRGKWGTISPVEAICETSWFGNDEPPTYWRMRLLGKSPSEKRRLRKQYESNIAAILQLLSDRGVNIDERNEFGQTPAEIATVNGNYLAFQFILNAGAVSAKILHDRSVSGDYINAAMMREAVVIGKNETYHGILMDIDARLFGARRPTRFSDVANVEAYQFVTAEDNPRPARGDIIYAANLGEQEVSAAFFVRAVFKATRLPPYKDYLLLEDRQEFDRDAGTALLASFSDVESEES